MTNLPQASGPTGYPIGSEIPDGHDAWLLPEGTFVSCPPQEHAACAEWLLKGMLWQEYLDIPGGVSLVHPFIALEKIGALFVANDAAVRRYPELHVTEKEAFRPSQAQLEAIALNGITLHLDKVEQGTLTGMEVFYKSAYAMISERVAKLRQTEWYAKSVKDADEYYRRTDYSGQQGTERMPEHYTPGMFPPRRHMYGGIETPESIANFERDPLRYEVRFGGASKEDESAAFDILSEGSMAGIGINSPQEFQEYYYRILPIEGYDTKVILFRMTAHEHDGMSAALVPYYRESSLSVTILSANEARAHLQKMIQYFDGRKYVAREEVTAEGTAAEELDLLRFKA